MKVLMVVLPLPLSPLVPALAQADAVTDMTVCANRVIDTDLPRISASDTCDEAAADRAVRDLQARFESVCARPIEAARRQAAALYPDAPRAQAMMYGALVSIGATLAYRATMQCHR